MNQIIRASSYIPCLYRKSILQRCLQKFLTIPFSSFNNMSNLREKLNTICFGGHQKIFAHDSEVTKSEMQFAIFLPPQAAHKKLPVIYYLSGLTMDHVIFIEKSGCQRYAVEQGVIIVAPDSSPRNTGIPDEKKKWNYGTKASYYIDTTQEPWSKHYQMHSYLSKELPKIINENFPVIPGKQSIIGHSIGGYGAFILAMKHPKLFVSTSAFSPVCDATLAPHSIEGLEKYLGKRETSNWNEWSTIHMAKTYNGPPLHFLIDQGSADEFLDGHLHPEEFREACNGSPISITYRLHEGYAHNYFFIQTFMEDHIKYHMQHLNSVTPHM